jgi:NAD(P)H-hydrate repair Nnr-like enzyme with NAD(P)H-hydrate dehydratase domain
VFVPQDVYSAVAPGALDTLVHPLNFNRNEAAWEKTLPLDANHHRETRLGAAGSDVPSDAAALAQALHRATAVVIGPGLGRTSFVAPLVGYLYRHVNVPMVLDADALHLVDLDVEPRGLRVLTPHWGEFRSLCMRLSGMKAYAEAGTPDEYQHSVSLLRRMISTYPVQVLLKGNPCLFANREMDVLMDTRGLDVVRAGLGDVLAGSIAGLLSQGEEVMRSMMRATLLGRLAVARMRVENGPRFNPLASQLPGYIQRVLGDDRGN